MGQVDEQKMKFMIFFVIVGILGFLLLGYLHEQVHVSIYSYYGIKTHVEYIKSFPDWITYPEKPCPTEGCTLANINAETLDYHAMPFYFMIFLGLAFIIGLIESNSKINKDYYS